MKFILWGVFLVVEKVLFFVVVNVENNFDLDCEDLVVSEVFVNEGLILKWFCLWVKGFVLLINKWISYIMIIVIEK